MADGNQVIDLTGVEDEIIDLTGDDNGIGWY
jgi:hypothetical protein